MVVLMYLYAWERCQILGMLTFLGATKLEDAARELHGHR